MTRSDTRLPAYAWGSEQKVATHPVAQLKQQDNPDEKPLQMTHRSLSPRTHPFHTIYDGDGKRIKKVVPNGETTVFAYDASSKLVAEYSTVVTPQQDAKVAYLTNDHLGSPRINTDQNGNVIARHDYHPFGEEISRPAYGTDTVRKQFTGYERDNETELDFAQARYYTSNLGRFASPDEIFADQDESNPQSWNLYSYVRNLPLNYIDPDGQWRRVDCTSETVIGPVCVEADEGDTYETLAKFFNWRNVGDLQRWFQNQSIATGQVFEVSEFVFKRGRPNDPGGEEVGMELFLAAEGGRGLLGVIKGGLKAAGNGIVRLFASGAAESSPAVVKTAVSELATVTAEDRNLLTWIGRALQKHSSRAGSAFKTIAKNPAQFNKEGEALAKEILENPAATRVPNVRGGSDVRLPDGRGIRFNSDGTPYSLLEPGKWK